VDASCFQFASNPAIRFELFILVDFQTMATISYAYLRRWHFFAQYSYVLALWFVFGHIMSCY